MVEDPEAVIHGGVVDVGEGGEEGLGPGDGGAGEGFEAGVLWLR